MTLTIFYLGVREVDLKTGLLGGLIFALHPLAIRYGVLMLNDIPAMTLVLIAYYCLLSEVYKSSNLVNKKISTEKAYLGLNNRIILAGGFFGLGVLLKLLVAPILLAFIVIILIEGYIEHIDLQTQMKQIGQLLLGFFFVVGLIFLFFFLSTNREFIHQILGQHLSKEPWESLHPLWSRLVWGPSRYYNVDVLLVIVLIFSIPFALMTRLGRGMIVIAAIMIVTVILIVPHQHHNYYDIHIPLVAMVCGFFPLSISRLLDLRKKLHLNHTEILNIVGLIFIGAYIISIAFASPYNLTPMDNDITEVVTWIKANTDPDEYILSDDTNINTMAERRGPFAEVSIDRADLGALPVDLMIQSMYDYQIRVVVATGRLFGKIDAYQPLMDFLEANYTEIDMGITIYLRDSPLNQ